MKIKKVSLLMVLFVFFIIPISVLALPVGDVDGDGNVSSLDYILVRKHLLNNPELTGDNLKRADVDGDGKVSSSDYIMIRKIILGVITITPAPTVVPIVTITNISADSEIKIIEGASAIINVKMDPVNATNNDITWQSTNPSVVSVDNTGKITAHTPGTAYVNINAKSGNKTAKCRIVVSRLKNHDIRNNAVKTYFNNTSNLEGAYKSNRCSNTNRCDQPNDYKSSIMGNVKIYTYDMANNSYNYITTTDSSNINYYLIPNNVYYLVSERSNTRYEYVKITGSLRMITVGYVYNVRDLGGWQTTNGTVKYGRIFRGANPDVMRPYDAFRSLKIGAQIDLRRTDEINKNIWSQDLRNIHKHYNIPGYNVTNSEKTKTRDAIQIIMKNVVNGKNVYFNCAGGRDRTGTIAYIIEGLLGVKREQRFEDYELTYFYTVATGLTRNHSPFMNVLVKSIDEFSSNDEMAFAEWYLSMSNNKNEDIKLINDFRKAMIDGSPQLYSISNNVLTLN